MAVGLCSPSSHPTKWKQRFQSQVKNRWLVMVHQHLSSSTHTVWPAQSSGPTEIIDVACKLLHCAAYKPSKNLLSKYRPPVAVPYRDTAPRGSSFAEGYKGAMVTPSSSNTFVLLTLRRYTYNFVRTSSQIVLLVHPPRKMESYRINRFIRPNNGRHPQISRPRAPFLIPSRGSSFENHDDSYSSGHSPGSLTREDSGEESSSGHSSVSDTQWSSGEDLIFDMSLSESSEDATSQTRDVPSILCQGCGRSFPPSEHCFHRRHGCRPPGHTPPTPIAQHHASSSWARHPFPPPPLPRQQEQLHHHQHGQYHQHQHQQAGPSVHTTIHPLGLAPAPDREQDDSPYLRRIPVQLSDQAHAVEEQRRERRRSDMVSQRHYSYPPSSGPRRRYDSSS